MRIYRLVALYIACSTTIASAGEPLYCSEPLHTPMCGTREHELVVVIEAQASIDEMSDKGVAFQDTQLNTKALLAKIASRLQCDATGCKGVSVVMSPCPLPKPGEDGTSSKLTAARAEIALICQTDHFVRSRLTWHKKLWP